MNSIPKVLTPLNNPSPKPSKFKKLTLIFLIIVLALSLIASTWYILKTSRWSHILFKPTSKEVKPKLVKETTVSQVATESYPTLFYINLEYDPKSKITTQLGTTKVNGDIPNFLPNQPQFQSGDFVYKVEVISEENELIQAGWNLIPAEIVSKKDGKILFSVITVYKQDALVRIYVSGQLIFTGKIV